MKYSVRKLEHLDSLKYSEFIENINGSMFYHTLAYKKLITSLLNAQDHYLIALDSNNRIVGSMPLIIKEGPKGKVCNSLAFYGANGGIVTDSAECFRLLLEAYNAFVLSDDIIASTVITSPFKPSDNYGNIRHDFVDYRIGQITDINFPEDSENNLMRSFHYKTRNAIRKAMKSSVNVRKDNSKWDFLIRTHIDNMTAIGGNPKPLRFFYTITSLYKENTDYAIYVAEVKNKTVAALLVFYYKDTVEYYTPVVETEYRSLQPLSLIIFEAMKEAAKAGFKFWNWGGTWPSQNGVYTFKKRWGTSDVNYYYYTYLKNPAILYYSKKQLSEWYEHLYVINYENLID